MSIAHVRVDLVSSLAHGVVGVPAPLGYVGAARQNLDQASPASRWHPVGERGRRFYFAEVREYSRWASRILWKGDLDPVSNSAVGRTLRFHGLERTHGSRSRHLRCDLRVGAQRRTYPGSLVDTLLRARRPGITRTIVPGVPDCLLTCDDAVVLAFSGA